jgi:hypothetical protein
VPADQDAVATELYALLPRDFVAARDLRAGEAKQAGDADVARSIKALRRPTVSAWLANWLARERPDDLGRLLDLGAAMRSAQDQLAGEDLRRLSRQRHQVVMALGAEARQAAAAGGLDVSDGVARELQATLNAALADPVAAAAVRAGRLAAALQHTGFSSDLTRAEAPPASGPPPPSAGVEPPPELEARRVAEQRRRLEAAEQALRAAEAEAADAAEQTAAQERAALEVRARADGLRRSISDLEVRLDALRREQLALAVELTRAESEVDQARQAQAAAEHRLVVTRRDLPNALP